MLSASVIIMIIIKSEGHRRPLPPSPSVLRRQRRAPREAPDPGPFHQQRGAAGKVAARNGRRPWPPGRARSEHPGRDGTRGQRTGAPQGHRRERPPPRVFGPAGFRADHCGFAPRDPRPAEASAREDRNQSLSQQGPASRQVVDWNNNSSSSGWRDDSALPRGDGSADAPSGKQLRRGVQPEQRT